MREVILLPLSCLCSMKMATFLLMLLVDRKRTHVNNSFALLCHAEPRECPCFVFRDAEGELVGQSAQCCRVQVERGARPRPVPGSPSSARIGVWVFGGFHS